MLYAAAFPEFGSCGRWIDDIREKHDPNVNLVAPHVTVFFPNDGYSVKAISAELSAVLKEVHPFKVVLRSALIMPDPELKDKAHVFLVPDEGFSGVVQIHRLIYSRNFRADLRLDLPFVPHITVASELSLEKAKELADSMNERSFEIEFLFDRLHIVEIQSPGVDFVHENPILLNS